MNGGQVWPHVISMCAAAALAGVGGELFVRGIVGMAARWRLSELLIALTVSACATSAPELTVSVMASAAGHSALAMGDALGSNVTNILLILGISLLFGPMAARDEALRWHFVCIVGAPLVLLLLLLMDGWVSRIDGALLLALFLAWLAKTIVDVRRGRAPASDPGEGRAVPHWVSIALMLAAGMEVLVVAGQLFTVAGSALAARFGLSDAVVGATVVALGTSMPELMTTLLSRWRGHQDVGLGTLLGSNLFNGLAVLGTAAMIAPIRVALLPIGLVLAFGVVAALLAMPRRNSLSRSRGAFMLVLYAVYATSVGVLFAADGSG